MRRRNRRSYRARASAYITVLGGAMLVSVLGLSVAISTRLSLRTSGWGTDAYEAGFLAFSAIEHALTVLDQETVNDVPNWRANYVSGDPQPEIAVDGGTISWMLVDADGDLDDNWDDALHLYGVGTLGDARRVYRVVLEPKNLGMDCLQTAAHSGTLSEVWDFNQTVNVNGAPWSATTTFRSWGTINGNIECSGTIQDHGTLNGTMTPGVPAKQVPDPNTVFDYYIKNGTRIEFSTLSNCSGTPCINGVALSSRFNPYGGTTNVKGIYVIDCGGGDVLIRNSRIVGTVVLLNAGANSGVGLQVNWEPALPGYPALMVGAGSFNIEVLSGTLDEFGVSANFNPVGVAYQGITDADMLDQYPSELNGIVYVSGDIELEDATINGVIVTGGDIGTSRSDTTITANLNYKATYYNNPPPGFRVGGQVVPVPGTYERSSLP